MSRGLTEQHEPASASPERPGKDPDSLIYGIRWPANRLTYGQMQTLRQISKDVRVPITQLLKDAVDVYLVVLQREMQAVMVAEQEHAGPSARDNPSATIASLAPHASGVIPTEPADENFSTDGLPSSNCHGSTKMIAEFSNNPATVLPATVELPSGPRTQLGFMFSED